MSSTANVSQLFQTAQEQGQLSPGSLQILEDLGTQIQEGLGVNPDDVKASEVVLVTVMPDDSGSIRFAGCAQAVRDGHNGVLDALGGSKQEIRDHILVHTRYLNGFVLYPYCMLKEAVRMDSHNYDPDKGTPLYEQTVILWGTVLAKIQEFIDYGVPARTGTLLVTDGKDEHSARQYTMQTCATLARDMLKTERNILAFMGVGDDEIDQRIIKQSITEPFVMKDFFEKSQASGRFSFKASSLAEIKKQAGADDLLFEQMHNLWLSTGFRPVALGMGIPENWIMTPASDHSAVRKAFGAFSKSMVRASQSAKSFSQTALGGLGNP